MVTKHSRRLYVNLKQIPTVLYYDQYQKVIGWGYDVSNALASTGYPKPGVQKLEWFKHHLWQNNSIVAEMLPPLPAGKTSIDVVSDYLLNLRQAFRIELRKCLGEIFNREESNIQYCFTVPTFFDNGAEAQLKKAIIQAGFIKDDEHDRLTFIAEPIATISFCSKSGLLDLHEQDIVMLIDCNSGTCDVSLYTVDKSMPFGFTEYLKTIGDACG
jgi:hypothetical protein